jgi:ArsR family transcriptional regulator
MSIHSQGIRGRNARALFERHAEMCKVISNPIRLMILNVLREREMSVAALADELGEALGTVSAHLLMMKRQQVLASRRQGNQVFYSLANPKMLAAFDLIREILREQMQREGRLAAGMARQRSARQRGGGR